MNKTGIEALIQLYFDSNYELDKQKARETFHPHAHIYMVRDDGTLGDSSVEAFVGIFDHLESPQSTGQAREDEILSLDLTGANTAVARVTLRIGHTRFTDILGFVYTDNRWYILTKIASGETL